MTQWLGYCQPPIFPVSGSPRILRYDAVPGAYPIEPLDVPLALRRRRFSERVAGVLGRTVPDPTVPPSWRLYDVPVRARH